MKKYLSKILTGLMLVFMVSAMPLAAAVQGDFEEQYEPGSWLLNAEDPEPKPVDPELLEKNLKFLEQFKNELQYTKTDYRQVKNNLSSVEYQLSRVVDEKVDLEYQINNLTDLVDLTTQKLIIVIDHLIETENEIKLIYEKIEIAEIAFEEQKKLLSDYTSILYREENEYFSDSMRLLLSDNTVGENLKELRYFDLLNKTGQQILERLDELSFDLDKKRAEYSDKLFELNELQDEIALEKEELTKQKEAKERLLVVTLGQENIYQQLLEQTQEEQGAALDSVKALSQAVAVIEADIIEKGEDFNPADYDNILTERGKSLYDFHIRYRGLGDSDFAWPADPFKGLSAYFRDPGYAGSFGVRHSAVDIPMYQGTPVRSAADGVVFATVDNGYGYSYVIVVHANGLSTVSGHVSDILVSEGEIVSKGEIIALSGGMPGTKGAGYMTTGPHLHFEVHKDGDYVDPLLYLPLEVLTESQMEWLPEVYKTAWKVAVKKTKGDLLVRG